MSPALSRRDLLGGLAGSVLASGMCRTVLADESPRRKFTMDLVCGNIGIKAPLPEAIAMAHRHGFESVAPEAGFLASISASQLSELRDDLKAKKLVWGGANLSVDFRGDEAKFRDGLRRLPGEAEGLQRAGASRMGTWIMPGHNSLTYRANFKQYTERLREIGNIVGDHGLRLGLEYVGPKTSWSSFKYPFIHTMAEMRELIAAIDRPNIGLVLDSWHWYTAHDTEADLLRLQGSDVICCDLNDAPAGVPIDQQRDGVRELPCATGVIDLKSFLNALVKIGYDGPVRAEPFNAELRRLPPEQALDRTAEAMRRAFRFVG
jgi:sugar phosphate isomerase/epimerase